MWPYFSKLLIKLHFLFRPWSHKKEEKGSLAKQFSPGNPESLKKKTAAVSSGMNYSDLL